MKKVVAFDHMASDRTPPGPAQEFLLAAAEVGRELAAPGAVEPRLVGGMRVLERRLGAARAVLYLADAEHRSIAVRATHGVSADQFRPRYGLGVAGRVAESRKPIVVPAVHHDAMALSELSESSLWSSAGWNLVAVPGGSSRGKTAVLCTYFRHRDPSGFAGRLSALDVVASLMGKAARAAEQRDRTGDAEPVAAKPPSERSMSAFEYSNMIGASTVMRQVYEQIGQVARTNATALLRGESGTGKELVARAIHENSARANRAFVKVNCAALPEPLFESELFGHERGAFTGAHAKKKGRFELADGGTLFLDEIGELSLVTQAKLLRVLQFREFERLGGTETIRTDARIVAATNQDLEHAVRDGRFREDLYYRINVFTIALPPLRERSADVPALAEYFLSRLGAQHERKISRISTVAMDLLTRHSWRGNVRELENVIERAVVVCDGSVIEERHLPASLRSTEEPTEAPFTLDAAVERLERRMIEDALRAENGIVAAAARVLGTTERILRYKAQRLRIDITRFRAP